MTINDIGEKLEKLTKHQLKIVQALYDAESDWLTRSQLARAIGKKRLTPYDIDCLQILSEQDFIEISTQPTTAPGSDFAYIYHMSDAVANTLQDWASNRMQTQENPQRRKPINLQ